MVSAVFHSPMEAARAGAPVASAPVAPKLPATPAAPFVPAFSEPPAARAPRVPRDWRGLWLRVLPPILGIGLLLLVWELVALRSTNGFPSPLETGKQALDVFSDPFYSKGPNDQGVGWNVLSSLQRVALGFGLAAA